MAWTNRGYRRAIGYVFRGETIPTAFYLALVTAANAPNESTKTMAELTEIAAGNGYTSGGVQITRDGTGFPTITENDNRGSATVVIADKSITASGGTVPVSGNAAKYIVLTGDAATVSQREIYAYWPYEFLQTAPATETIDMNGLSLTLESNGYVTSRGCYLILNYVFRGVSVPSNYYVALFTNATAPTIATNTFSELTEMTAGNGYVTGGYQLTRGVADFPTASVDDVADIVTMTFKTIYWTASGGTIPPSGSGATYVGLTTNEGTVSTRQIIGWFAPENAPLSATDGTLLTVAGAAAEIIHGDR